MWQQVNAVPGGSDRQKIWFDHWVTVAEGDTALERMRRLLSGERAVEGLTLDQDRRWALVKALNRHAYRDYKAIARAEAGRDGSRRGRLNALGAEALRPDPAVKETWLERITAIPAQYKLAELTEVMTHLFPAEQAGLMERNAERILRALPELADHKDDRFMQRYTRNLAPATCRPASVERLAEAIDRYADLNPAVGKALRIAHQEDRRCVAIGRLLAD